MPQARKQRIDGRLDRAFPAEIRLIRQEAGADGAAAQDGNVRLELSFSSETPYTRSSWFDDPWVETLGHKDGEVDLSRLADGAPLLANHQRGMWGPVTPDSPLASIGVVEKAWVDNQRGMAQIKLSRRDGMDGLLTDLADGIVRNVSVGYQVLERTLTKDYGGKQPNEYRVTRWMPMEISLVDIPADASVGIGRSADRTTQYRVVDLPDPGATSEKGKTMDEDKTTGETGTQTATVVDLDAARREAAQLERARIAEITTMVRSVHLDAALATDLINRGVSTDAAGREILTKLAERDERGPQTRSAADIVNTRDERDVRVDAMAGAIFHRIAPRTELPEQARPYRYLSLGRMAEECLLAQGIRTRGLSALEIATRAMISTSDFPSVLAAVANKRLRQQYDETPATYQRWARRAPNAADFKTINVTQLGGAPDLVAVPEGGEFTYGSLSDGKETYAVISYGKILPISRQAIINDDLRAFDRLPQLFASAAKRLENRTVYSILTANAALADGTALFHANHSNLAGSGAVISNTTLAAGRAAMRLQKGLQSEELNIAPAYLIVPATQEQLAYQWTSQNYVPTKSTDVNEFRIGGRTALEVVAESVLDGNSTTAWYLAADNAQIDTVEFCYLDGTDGVYLESQIGFEIDGIELKARLDFGAKAIDYRGLYKNPGA